MNIYIYIYISETEIAPVLIKMLLRITFNRKTNYDYHSKNYYTTISCYISNFDTEAQKLRKLESQMKRN